MNTIRLLGIRGDNNYEIWKSRIEKILDSLSVKTALEEVNSVDEILSFGSEAIPALLIGKEIVIQQNNHIIEEEELRVAIEKFYLKKRQKMKKIIVPTDFSQTAHNAFLYAEAISQQLGSPLKVINVSHPSTDSIDGVTAPMIEDLLEMRQKNLEKFVNVERTAPGYSPTDVLVEAEAIAGLAKSTIVDLSKDENTEMIVMGTTGERGVLINVLGSISTGVSQYAKCPVWLVPPEAKFEGINHILYASNFESADDELVMQAAKLAEQFDAMIHFIHVQERKELEDFTETEGKIFDRLFAKGAPDFPFKMKIIYAKTVEEGLNNYAKKQAVDLIVIANRQRSFWESLIGKSMTKKMILNVEKPILVYHIEKE